VLAGQSLWGIAIAYGVRVDEIKRLNNLSGDDIYPGNRLLIRQGVVLPALSLEPTSTIKPTASPVIVNSPTSQEVHVTLVPVPSSAVAGSNHSVMGFAVGILVLAIVGGGIFAWLGRSIRE
jgi:hypothetical protein